MFDMLYGGSAAALIARQSFFSVPLWFAEGMAEYFSLGMESNAEMFLRDGTIEGYLPPLQYSGGYLVYKQGQSAISYLVERYGEERLRDLLRRIRPCATSTARSSAAIGMPVASSTSSGATGCARGTGRRWPRKDDPERVRAPAHRPPRATRATLNTSPAISPQGDRIAYFSDRRQYTDVY